jgi:hypothetical protein
VAGDMILVSYVSRASASTPAGTYASGPNAITPVLADPDHRLSNYMVTLTPAPLTITAAGVPSFSIGTSQPSTSIAEGQSGTEPLTLTPANGFSGSIALQCSGLPSAVACAIDPATLHADGSNTPFSAVVNISVPAVSASLGAETTSRGLRLGSLGSAPGIVFSALLVFRRRKLAISRVKILLLSLAVTSCVSCGGTSSVPAPSGAGSNPSQSLAGTYTAKVMATGAGINRTASFEVTITP